MYTVVIAAVNLWLSFMVGVRHLSEASSACRRDNRRQDDRGPAQGEPARYTLVRDGDRRRTGMPLTPAIVAFADQYRGRSYRRIIDLAADIAKGGAVPPRRWNGRGKSCRRRGPLGMDRSSHWETCPSIADRRDARASHLPVWTSIASRITYILMLVLAIQTVIGFLLYFIVPKFEAIFRDFNTSLPQITIYTIKASHFIVKYFFPILPIFLLELFLLFYIPFSLVGWGNFDFPLFDRLLIRRHAALILRALSLVVESGTSMSVGVQTLADHYPTTWIRRRLRKVASEVTRGGNWIESLESHGLIRSTDAKVLRSAGAVGNLRWAMGELAESCERRLAFRFQSSIQFLFPLVVRTLGFLVFLFALAYFAPLVKLITELSHE